METKYVVGIFVILLILLIMTACGGPKGDKGDEGPGPEVIQFCSGTTTYGGPYNEAGLIINGKVYGVYSVNDGFLTEMPPGRYTSNAVGSSCDFTLNSNLTISY